MKEKKVNRGKWLSSSVCLVIGMLAGFTFARLAKGQMSTHGAEDPGIFLIRVGIELGIVCLFLYLQIIIHEAGHLIAGKLTGYHFVSFRIGSLMLIRKKGKLVLKRYKLMGTGGQCLMLPPENSNGDYPCVGYNMGGCIANLITVPIALYMWHVTSGYGHLSIYFLEIALIGGASALLNGIPMRVGSIDNDGYNALHLGENKEAKKCLWLQLKINAMLSDEIPVSELPKQLFYMPEDIYLNNAFCAAEGLSTYGRALDEKDFDKAKEIGEHLLEHASGLAGLHRNLLQAEMLFCELISDQDVERINRFYTKEVKRFLKAFRTHPTGVRIQYAIELLFNKNEEKADQVIKAFDKLAKYYPNACEIESEKALMTYTKACYSKQVAQLEEQ